jgi:hypothetical protein
MVATVSIWMSWGEAQRERGKGRERERERERERGRQTDRNKKDMEGRAQGPLRFSDPILSLALSSICSTQYRDS